MAKSGVKKKGKARWIIISVILVVVLLIGVFIIQSAKAVKQMSEAMTGSQTAAVTTRTLIKSVGATGKILSENKKDISVDLQGIKLKEINVSVGDSVKKNDLLVTFDTSDIEENLSDAKESLDKTNQQNKLTENSANRNVQDTKRQAEYSIDGAKESVDSAKESYDETVSNLDSYRTQFSNTETQANTEKANIEAFNKKIKEQNKTIKEAKANLESTAAAYETAVSSYKASLTGKSEEEIADGEQRGWDGEDEASVKLAFEAMNSASSANTEAAGKLSKAESKLASLSSSLEKSEANLATLNAKLETLNAAIEKLEDTEEQLKKTYDSAVKQYNNVVSSQQSAIASVNDSKKSTELSLQGSTKAYEKQIETYTEQLENGKLYSPIDGVVTAVNYAAGDSYQAGAVVTVQDTKALYIESEISEYDISDIVVGQKVLIKTDATRDEEMNGTVTFVSPTASVSAGTQATYTVKISIDNPSDRLRLDMTASLSIIIEEHENVLTVPYNAISTDDEGNTFVFLQNEDGSFESVYVTVLMESNYYSEISSERLKDGDVLQIIPSEGANDYWDTMTEEGFVF